MAEIPLQPPVGDAVAIRIQGWVELVSVKLLVRLGLFVPSAHAHLAAPGPDRRRQGGTVTKVVPDVWVTMDNRQVDGAVGEFYVEVRTGPEGLGMGARVIVR